MPRHRSPFARIKKPLKSDMNVVPYIDVMLVLLVIFMVTAPMITTGISVDLPKANSNSFESKSQPAIVTIKADGSYYLQINGHGGNEALSLDDVKSQLADAQKAAEDKQQKLMVLVNGDRHVDYGTVVKLMSNLQDAGLQQVGLLTDPPRQ
jgi:biopolymer transport protein TolR